jgi:hypothetical protein
VRVAREFAKELRRSPHKPAIESIREEIEMGIDLTPRLSEDVDMAYIAPGRSRGDRRRDNDESLAHDELHQLHLGRRGTGRFVARTGTC